MKIVGLIAEYNPFHNGHLYHLQESRKAAGADAAVIVTSGDYLQRGTPAVMPKHLRAEMALQCGAAAVFELPVCYATGSAELFAFGAVSLLDALGVDAVCFGSECGNLRSLQRLADILCEEPEEYKHLLKTHVKEGGSFPAARERAVRAYLTSAGHSGNADERQTAAGRSDIAALLGEPNNILAVEYLKALQKLKSPVTPYTIRRVSCAYHDDSLHPGYSSASAIRRELERGKGAVPPRLETQVPPSCMKILRDHYYRSYPIGPDDFSLLLKYKLLNTNDEDLPLYQDVSTELANRVTNMQGDYVTYMQFAESLMTRQFTRTRVCRALLHILLDIKKTDVESHLADGAHYYARLLGFRKDCKDAVSELAKRTRLPLLTNPKNPGSGVFPENARRMLETNVRASSLYNSVVTDKYRTPLVNEFSQKILKI